MNYRHAYHAGNFADVIKHIVLSRVIAYMKQKSAPFRVIDTHAGCGRYDLQSEASGKTREWEAGIGRLAGPAPAKLTPATAALLEPYLSAVKDENGGGVLRRYPGSPRLALRLIRPDDRLVANELHPEDAAALKAAISRDARARILTLDAWTALRAQLPPPERRGVILIDPPFEEPGEFERISEGLAEGLQRFASGVFLAWYPIKDLRAVETWQRSLATLGTDKVLVVDFLLRKSTDADVLNGCGLIMVNPPFTLRQELETVLPEMVACLSDAGTGRFVIRALTDLKKSVPVRKKPSHGAN